MASKAKCVFSGLLLLLVSLVFTFAFSLSILLANTKTLDDLGIIMISKDQVRTTINSLEVRIYPTEEELTESIEEYLNEDDTRLRAGFAIWTPSGQDCTIFVIEPHTESDFEAWGHELGHCVYGHWHTKTH